MKKILLIVGIAFGCSSVYAQNVIDQNGDGNSFSANQDQVTNPLTVYKVKQYKGYNVTNITQGADVNAPGQENIATLRQISIGVTALNFRNIFNVNQSGASNRINSDQYGMNNRANLTQTINTNGSQITTSQSGWNNGIIINQTGDASGGSSQYEATIQQGQPIPGGTYASPGTVGPLPATSRNSATLTQSGSRGTATITQEGSLGLFSGVQRGGEISANQLTVFQNNNAGATVEQSGNANRINVNQRGYQYATVKQASMNPAIDTEPVNSVVVIRQGTNALDDSRNSARVEQTTGDGNRAEVDQRFSTAERNYATIRQAGTKFGGTNSSVLVTQEGKSSTVVVEQLKGGSGNTATFYQSESELFKGSNAMLQQKGDQNTFTSSQLGKANNIGGTIGNPASFATQMGLLNTANLTQDGQGNDIAMNQDGTQNQITVDQVNDRASGVGNKATATQGSSSSNSQIIIDQTIPSGDENVAVVNQTKGDGNIAAIGQYEQDMATITQSGTDDDILAVTSTVTIDQSTATSAKATVTQADGTKGGQVQIAQGAIGNEATVNQTKGRVNTAIVVQADDENTAMVTQSGTIDGAASTAVVQQLGKEGMATITQSANGSTTEIDQYGGDRNESTITQAGRLNAARTEQGGDDNKATIGQMGDNNDARTLQGGVLGTLDHADNTTMITQAGTSNDAVTAQGGQMNTAAVMQTSGRDNFAATIQYGTSNTVSATQSSPGKNNTITVQQLKTNSPGDGGGSSFGSRDASTVAEAIKTAGADYGTSIDQVENNKATVSQTAGENQLATVLQTGDDETLLLNQGNTDNTAFVLQAGEFDQATLTQNGSFGIGLIAQYGTDGQNGNRVTATQAGSYNAFVTAQGYHDNVITIDQKGSENGLNGSGVLTGGILAAQYGQRNSIDIKQDANTSVVAVAQGNIAPAFPSIDLIDLLGFEQVFDNKITVDQKGRRNIALVGQQEDLGTAAITQAGENNIILIAQLNVGLTDVFSLPNTATATQTALVSNSDITITQQGRGSVATATQNAGRFNSITLNQTLDQHTATLTQNGGNTNVIAVNQGTDPGRKGNTVTITQEVGDRNTAQLDQTGYENTLTLTQNGDDNTLRRNGGDPVALQGGHNNTATLSQTGQLHTINFTQTGMNNMATITQSN